MNEIVMIPIDQLRHHPENPRKDLGDLTEFGYQMSDEEIQMMSGTHPIFRKGVENDE